MGEAVRIEENPAGFRIVSIDRPETRNAIDAKVVAGLSEALATASGPAIVVASTHPAAFSSGADLNLEDEERSRVSDTLYGLYREMRSSPKIIITAARGHAVGGGAQLLIASDLRFVSADTIIRFMGPGHGLAVGAWGLPSLVGRGRAIDLCLSMRRVEAGEALSMGLVDRVVEDPVAEAAAFAEWLCTLDADAVAAVKRIVGISSADAALKAEQEQNRGWDGSVPGRD